ncbi:MAG TPA: hypothetical protein VK470_00730, partial [Bacteroidota bacterium]|nr:hypothetical protein [Bacteroidota bacterium]
TRFMGRAFVRRGLLDFLQIEAGGFASGIAGSSAVTETNYKTDFFGGDLRLLLMPYIGQSIVPYVYGGGGMLHYSIVEYTLETPTEFKRKDWVGYIPLGAGVLINWQQNTYFELSAGYNQSLSKELSGIKSATNDRFVNFLFGVTVSFE